MDAILDGEMPTQNKNLFLPFQIVFLVVRGYPRISNGLASSPTGAKSSSMMLRTPALQGGREKQ